MRSARFFAHSKLSEKALTEPWASAVNTPKRIPFKIRFKHKALRVLVIPEKRFLSKTDRVQYFGIGVVVENTTKKAIDCFGTYHNMLFMKTQARTRDGKWKDIEILPERFRCSYDLYFTVLPPCHYWQMYMPIFEGDFHTKLRVVLFYADPDKKHPDPWMAEMKVIYSNEFEGNINPGQFWRRTAPIEYFFGNE